MFSKALGLIHGDVSTADHLISADAGRVYHYDANAGGKPFPGSVFSKNGFHCLLQAVCLLDHLFRSVGFVQIQNKFIAAHAGDKGSSKVFAQKPGRQFQGVVSGTVSETWYRAVDTARAVPTEEHDRQAGYVACMLPTGPNIHRMQNRGPGEAISIHIYGFVHEAHSSSIETEYTAVAG